MLRVFSFLLPSSHVPQHLRQLIYITNILALILSGLTFILCYLLFNIFGWLATFKYILLVADIFVVVIFINRINWNLGRILFCLTPVWMTIFVSLYGKAIHSDQSYITYFDARMLLLATTILPAIVFKLYERLEIAVCLLSTFVFLILFDPIHNALGLGYYQRGFDVTSYYYINYIAIISYFVLLFGVIVLKSITEKAERSASLLIEEKDEINIKLSNQNVQLLRLNEDSEVKNTELYKQQEELSKSREKLQAANMLILDQQQMLRDYNSHLEAVVEEKNQSLTHANDELIKHNNELRQFSYSISHNLRGPVARLLGLTYLVKNAKNEEDRNQMLHFIEKSTIDLDEVLKDLSHIIDIRNELYHVREKINLEEEWNKVRNILTENIKREFELHTDFTKAPYVFAIRAMLHSILFNLLSNAIKYRSPDRSLIITISSQLNIKNDIILEIRDNGLGIDLYSHQHNIFKLYKRFHTHVGGKGIGLFLVKTQVEALNGTIEIESQLNVGTCFRIALPTPHAVDKQIFFESDVAQLYYDANLNITMLIWKSDVTSLGYRNAFESLLQTLKTYNTPGWIADLRQQGKVNEDDQIWFFTYVLPEAVRHGLKRIAAVGFKDAIRESYYKRMIMKADELGVNLQVFSEQNEALQWMQSFLHESYSS